MCDDFSPDGRLSRAIAGFKPRAAQQMMAEQVKQAIQSQQALVVEAGTGTGKTFAYLVPALRCGKKVIISTGSKNLQDQLFSKDLPIISQALEYSGKVALLKGRANYLCLERLAYQNAAPGALAESLRQELQQVKRWSLQTKSGDISQCTQVGEDSQIWPLVTSTNDNCLGADCPNYEACYVVKARRRAMAADVVVVNHHLFLADVVVKDTGFGELIPKAAVMVFDEAHQLPDLACQYFGQQLSSRQLFDLAKAITLAYRLEVKDMAQLQKCADKLQSATQELRLAISEIGLKGDLRELFANPKLQAILPLLTDALQFCQEVLQLALGRSKSLDNCFERVHLYQVLLKRLSEVDKAGYSYWYECSARHFILALTPLSVADKFSELMLERQGSWIFTSATLSVNNQLDYFSRRLGLTNAQALILPSPFNYQQQTLLCVPRYIPSPNEANSAVKLAKILLPVIEANQGRCFLLCTSYMMMHALAEQFKQLTHLPILVQGETSKSSLLQQFIDKGNALLIATSSFWEGVDVQGDALSCVIIDKLPFVAPDEPMLKARMQDCQRQGGDPFNDIQLPEAIITLKQGVGRLIRGVQDRGVIIICDNRLVMRPYGATFINSLPPSPRTRDLQKVIQFLTAQSSQNLASESI